MRNKDGGIKMEETGEHGGWRWQMEMVDGDEGWR